MPRLRSDSMSTLDLVMAYQQYSLLEAARWICARWDVPRIGRHTKVARPERWRTNPVGTSNLQPLEELVRSGYWSHLDDPSRSVLLVLVTFAEHGTVQISYRGIARYSGVRSSTTIAKVLRRFKNDGLLRADSNRKTRDCGVYTFTFDGAKFQSLLSTIHEALKRDRDTEITLRAQLRTVPKLPASTPPAPAIPKSNPLSTQMDKQQSARSTQMDELVVPLSTQESATHAQLSKSEEFDCQAHGKGCVDDRGYPRCWDGGAF